MPNRELVDYINSSLSAGESPEKIRVNLITSGWKEEEVDVVLNKLVSTLGVNNPIANFEIKHNKKDLSPLYYLLGALILDIVGFGVCAMNFDFSSSPSDAVYLLYISAYLFAATFSLISIIRINRVNQITGLKRSIVLRIVITILAIIVGGWGAVWGGSGLYGFVENLF